MAVSPEAIMRSPDRILVLSIKPGKNAKNSIGMTDPKLFTGENKLHCIKEEQTNFWFFRYEHGGLPEPLKCKFTSFKKALEHAENYYNDRSIEIKEVLD